MSEIVGFVSVYLSRLSNVCKINCTTSDVYTGLNTETVLIVVIRNDVRTVAGKFLSQKGQ